MTFEAGALQGQTFGVVFVATSDNTVAAYAEEHLLTGNATPLWTRSLGAPSTAGGSNIPPPVGICSTPVIDAANRRMFVMAKLADSEFWIFSLLLDSGAILTKAQLKDSGAPGRPTFVGTKNDQRAR